MPDMELENAMRREEPGQSLAIAVVYDCHTVTPAGVAFGPIIFDEDRIEGSEGDAKEMGIVKLNGNSRNYTGMVPAGLYLKSEAFDKYEMLFRRLGFELEPEMVHFAYARGDHNAIITDVIALPVELAQKLLVSALGEPIAPPDIDGVQEFLVPRRAVGMRLGRALDACGLTAGLEVSEVSELAYIAGAKRPFSITLGPGTTANALAVRESLPDRGDAPELEGRPRDAATLRDPTGTGEPVTEEATAPLPQQQHGQDRPGGGGSGRSGGMPGDAGLRR